MILQIIELLKMDDFKGVSKNIDIAKGKYKLPESTKELINKAKIELWQKK